MKALVLTKKNELPELKEDIPTPPTSPEDDVVLELQYSALNHRDVWITKGKYPNVKEGVILGSDGMGLYNGERYIINPGLNWGKDESVQSKSFEVLGLPKNGTFADRISVSESLIHKVPSHLSDIEAAALPLGGVTAYRTLFHRCQLEEGENVLINGVGGGVAHFALLFALAKKANVFVTSGSDKKIDKAKTLGAKEGANYKKDNHISKLRDVCPKGFDVIIDSAAGDQFKHLIKLCAPAARIGIYGGTLGPITQINPQILFWRQISILGSTMGSESDFDDMVNYVEEHEIYPVIDKVIPLSNYQLAFKRMANADQFGKIVFDHNA